MHVEINPYFNILMITGLEGVKNEFAERGLATVVDCSQSHEGLSDDILHYIVKIQHPKVYSEHFSLKKQIRVCTTQL